MNSESPSSRMERINELIRRKLSEILISKCNDPRVRLVYVNKVSVSADLSAATVLFGVRGTDQADIPKILQGLTSAAGFFRSEIAKISKLRRFPRLRFVHDHISEKGDAVRDLLDKLGSSSQQ